MCLVKSTYLRERGGQQEKRYRIISVGFDRPSQPYDCFLVAAEMEVRCTRVCHPVVSQRIARTEAQGLGNVKLCFFGSADTDPTKPDGGVGAGEISIQRQRMFTFSDAKARRAS